jgi:hypothetical protein
VGKRHTSVSFRHIIIISRPFSRHHHGNITMIIIIIISSSTGATAFVLLFFSFVNLDGLAGP